MPIEISEVFYPRSRAEWRGWLAECHKVKPEVWIQSYRKASGKFSLPYDDMVEECLCFGWIDGIIKKYGEESTVQRITPRRKKSFLSELNRQRIWKLQAEGLMMPEGIAPIAGQLGAPDDAWEMPDWIRARLQADPQVWAQFQSLPHFYKRLKIGWIIETGKLRQEEQEKRLRYFIAMTAKGKRYGTQPLRGWDGG